MSETIMIVAAHPDDAEIAMGGSIARLLSEGHCVVVVDLTNGEPTPHGSVEIRAAETRAANNILGITERRNLDLPNREVFDTVENRKLLANVIREYRPSLLFAHYWQDAHPDHVQACQLTEASRFYAKFVKAELSHEPFYPRKLFHFFSTHIRPNFEPAFLFDVSSAMEAKMRALEAYQSQFVTNQKNVGVLELVRSENAHWGKLVGSDYAEPYVCRENIRIRAVSGFLDA